MSKAFIHSIFLFFFCAAALAQTKTAIIKPIKENSAFSEHRITYRDTLEFQRGVSMQLAALHQDGYLLAGFLGANKINDSLQHVFIEVGARFKWAQLTRGSMPEPLLSKVGFREKVYDNTEFKIGQVNSLFERVIKQSQNQGYPFAWVSLDSVQINEFKVSAALKYEPGPLITFDSLEIAEHLAVKRKWLQSYLNIVPGKPFDQSVVNQIEKRIENLDFLELEAPSTIAFENEAAIVSLELKKVPSNKIDGIVGFLPNENDGSLLITGQFDVELSNLFNSGKSIEAHWQSLKPRSQLLELGYLHRNLFRSPLHFNGSFYLLKEDTLFINRKGRLAFHYQPSAHDLSFFSRFESSRVLSNEVPQDQTVGEVSDFNINYYGLSYGYSDVTRARVPNGLQTYLELAVGNKSIRNASNLPPEVRSQIDLKSTQYVIEGNVQWQQPLGQTFGAMLKLQGGKLINDQLFINDLFRVGGLQTIRGFNENFFFASDYGVITTEARLYYEPRSFVFAFYDQSYIYYSVNESTYSDYPFGIGVGLSLNTKSGLLNLVYALGRSEDQPLSVSLSKFHFGYVANF